MLASSLKTFSAASITKELVNSRHIVVANGIHVDFATMKCLIIPLQGNCGFLVFFINTLIYLYFALEIW